MKTAYSNIRLNNFKTTIKSYLQRRSFISGLSPGGRFPPSFIHQVVIITGLNKLQLYVLALRMALDADRA